MCQFTSTGHEPTAATRLLNDILFQWLLELLLGALAVARCFCALAFLAGGSAADSGVAGASGLVCMAVAPENFPQLNVGISLCS